MLLSPFAPTLDHLHRALSSLVIVDREFLEMDNPAEWVTRPKLPNEILSEIVRLAMFPHRKQPEKPGTESDLTCHDDKGLFTAKKSKLFVLHGMLMASKLLRDVVLKEWFQVLRISVNDWRSVPSFSFDIMSTARFGDLISVPRSTLLNLCLTGMFIAAIVEVWPLNICASSTTFALYRSPSDQITRS